MTKPEQKLTFLQWKNRVRRRFLIGALIIMSAVLIPANIEIGLSITGNTILLVLASGISQVAAIIKLLDSDDEQYKEYLDDFKERNKGND